MRPPVKNYDFGFDIGGTKCAVILGGIGGDAPAILAKRRFATADCPSPRACLEKMCALAGELRLENGLPADAFRGVGISCGGPLNPVRGIIQSPPNLPGWDDVPAAEIVSSLTGLPARLQNDANACALAEWRFGAGRGTRDMVFLTFGTGMGAGIIANGALVSGCSGMAGECGHIRLAPDGPEGYGKHGSFEGFCSGGGIARLARARAEAALRSGRPFAWCKSAGQLKDITAKSVAEAADSGDSDAKAVFEESGARLGQALALLVDILNPERIVIGSIFARAEHLLRPAMERAIAAEALPQTASACKVVPAALGEAVGDFASLAVAEENGR